VLERLADLPGLSCRAMFGGHGLYTQGRFFGIIYRGRLYFRTDEATRPRYQCQGMGPFRPNRRQTLWTYYEVPPAVLADPDELTAWARQAAG
jgi:DNA transformation protein